MTGRSAHPGNTVGTTSVLMRMRAGHCHSQAITARGRTAHPHTSRKAAVKTKDIASQLYSLATRKGVAVIEEVMLSSGVRRHPVRLHDVLPVEADPADWAEQQQSVPLPDDEYPRVDGDRRVLITTGGLEID